MSSSDRASWYQNTFLQVTGKITDSLSKLKLTLPVKKSMVNRILLVQLLWALCVYLAVVGVLWWNSNRLIEVSVQHQARQWVREMDSLGTRVYVSRVKRLPQIEQRMQNTPEIAYVRFFDKSGSKVLYQHSGKKDQEFTLAGGMDESQVQHLAQLGTQGDELPVLFDPATYESVTRVLTPVRVRSIAADDILNFDPDKDAHETTRVIGFIDLGMDRSYYLSYLLSTMLYTSLGILTLFIVSVWVGRGIVVRSLAPLSNLMMPLARLARGERDVEVQTTGDEEISAISRALNTTIDAVRERDNSLRQLAEYDSLTGLVNRNRFTQELETEIARITRGGEPASLFFVDLDQFKYINDTLGHAAGDRLLQQVGNALMNRMRDVDIVARFGGDEFAILARGTSQRSATGLANSLLKLFRDLRFNEGEHALHVHCSIGITLIDSGTRSAQDFLAQADMACHQAKASGRNCYSVYQEKDDAKGRMAADMSWSQAILNAIAQDGFAFQYQPIVSASSEEWENYEVLLRMVGDDGELIAPSAFLSSAERFGLMPKIDAWVIRNAIQALAGFNGSKRKVRLFINLSGHIFKDTEIISSIRDMLKQHKVPPEALCLEVTEQVAVQHLEEASLLMRSLQKIGCLFALDDFGAGFSSLTYIKHLPIDFIKIDGSFVSNMRHDQIDQAMVQLFAQVGKTLGKKTVAEYVENLETLAMLKKLGVTYFQGYYVGKPQGALPDKALSLRKIKARS